MASTMFGERIQRNPFRARKKSGRSRTNALESMTPQGQALWASRNVCNAFGFIGPSIVGRKPTTKEMFNHLRTVEEMEKLATIILNHKG
tara:strand:- start:566 stop:832 length:267 start_codon:yes stop_codon:yes gene_type:complete